MNNTHVYDVTKALTAYNISSPDLICRLLGSLSKKAAIIKNRSSQSKKACK